MVCYLNRNHLALQYLLSKFSRIDSSLLQCMQNSVRTYIQNTMIESSKKSSVSVASMSL